MCNKFPTQGTKCAKLNEIIDTKQQPRKVLGKQSIVMGVDERKILSFS